MSAEAGARRPHEPAQRTRATARGRAWAPATLLLALAAGCGDAEPSQDASTFDTGEDVPAELGLDAPGDAGVDVPPAERSTGDLGRDGTLRDTSPGDGPSADVIMDGGSDGGVFVRITAPVEGALPANPVAFRVAAAGVARVRLLADQWPLGPAWDPATRDNLVYAFGGPARERLVVALGLDLRGAERARHAIRITAPAAGATDTGRALGSMWNTFYYVAREADHPGAADTTLFDATCMPLARVSRAFSDAVCIEGTGLLADGRVINASASCRCGAPCRTGGIVCYLLVDALRFPWGLGARGNGLVPLRSWAVDRSFVPLGTSLYVPRWDGFAVPAVDGLGGFVHDGCFRADDVGGGIRGNQFDFFAGTARMWRALERSFPTRTNFLVQRDAGRCAYLTR